MTASNIIPFTILAVLFLVATFVSHYYYEEYLWFKSVETWIPGLQGVTWLPWKRFVQGLFFFGWELMWLCVVIFYAKFNRASSAFLINTSCLVVWSVTMFKMYFSRPAPYMDRDYIDTPV